ncbi:MAG: hemerythrin family protein [Hyphomicrobiales bacterium]|nr:hemerythrin family protein [Hyphomicrobiales bacterium]
MTPITWSQAMSVGVAKLDQDHQTLLELINRIAEADEAPVTYTRIIPEVLVILMAYTVYHFQREERVMIACGYPDLETHREEHWALTREVHLLQRRFSDDPHALTREEVLRFLTGWLNHHIMLQDMDYKAYCAGKPQAEAAAEEHGDFDLSTLLSLHDEPEHS